MVRQKPLEKIFPDLPDLTGLFVAGVDEVGRGPLVGAVVTAAVILDPARPIMGLADSKVLTEKKRLYLADEIREKALCFAYGRAEPHEIDELNILRATLLAMQRAVAGLSVSPQHILVDGNRCPPFLCPATAVVKGDSRVASISAASILAKVQRDGEMQELHARYPQFGFDRHKGYPTAEHFAVLNSYGPIPEHRRSFAPVREALAARLAGIRS